MPSFEWTKIYLGKAHNNVTLWITSIVSGREIAPNTGANATKFSFGDQILKIGRQIGD